MIEMQEFSKLPLFSGNPETECQRMMECFRAPLKSFRPGETAYTYGGGGETVGILLTGTAAVVKIDAGGGRTVLERLSEGGVFGELIAFASLPCDSVSVVCETACEVLLLPQETRTSPCGKACDCHRILIENMLSLISRKAFALSERVEVLSCRTIREKLLCCFRIFAAKEHSLSFTLPFSLSALADYICSDRSAMMRELKRLREEGFLEVSGRNVRFLSEHPFEKADLCAASLV